MKGEQCYGGKTTEEIVQCSGVFLMLVLSFMIMCALMLNLWTGDRENAASKAELRLLAIKNTLTDCANAADKLAVAIREPVYLGDEVSDDTFWGFSIIIAKMEDVLIDSHIEQIDGFRYRIETDVNGETVTVSEDGNPNLRRSVLVTMEILGKEWRMYVMPHPDRITVLFILLSDFVLLLVSIGVSFLYQYFVTIRDEKKELESHTDIDSLTGLYNRHGFDKAAMEALERREVHRAVIVAIDANDFKLFNDLYGHAIGDLVLKTMGEEMRAATTKNDLLARNGGDEFQILMIDPTDEEMGAMMEFFNRTHYFTDSGHQYEFRLSAGFATYPTQSMDFYQLCKMADQAMIEFLNCATIDDLLQYSNGKLTAIFPSDDRRKLQRNIKKFAKLPVGQHAHSTYRVTTKDGKEKQVFVTSRWMHNDHFGDIFFTSMVEQEDFLLKAGEVSKREHREIK
jgi:diguanylate cyclase (GGDEF)-like protein